MPQVFTHSLHSVVNLFLSPVDTCLKTLTSAIRLFTLPLTLVEQSHHHYEHQLCSIRFNYLFLNSLDAKHLPSPSALQQNFVPALVFQCLLHPHSLCVYVSVLVCSCVRVCIFLFSCRVFVCSCVFVCVFMLTFSCSCVCSQFFR